VRLAILLRMLGGASYLDIQLIFHCGRSTIYSVFYDTIDAVLRTLRMPGVPVYDAEAMRNLASGFHTSRRTPNPLWGCIGALDGIAIAITKPLDRYFPRHYWTRKGFYAIPVQAICDSSYRFLYMSARCVGSSHDSLAWACSDLGSRFMEGLQIGLYWIAADAAYVCSNYILTPFSKSQIHDGELGPRRDAYNFYQSSHRIHVEQSFGLLVARFGILWKPIRFPLPIAPRILAACMRVHNFCIDNNVTPMAAAQSSESASIAEEAFRVWWRNAELERNPESQQGRRTDLHPSSKRDHLADTLHIAGVQRPNAPC
jgi:DDE superfamily endonuclease